MATSVKDVATVACTSVVLGLFSAGCAAGSATTDRGVKSTTDPLETVTFPERFRQLVADSGIAIPTCHSLSAAGLQYDGAAAVVNYEFVSDEALTRIAADLGVPINSGLVLEDLVAFRKLLCEDFFCPSIDGGFPAVQNHFITPENMRRTSEVFGAMGLKISEPTWFKLGCLAFGLDPSTNSLDDLLVQAGVKRVL